MSEARTVPKLEDLPEVLTVPEVAQVLRLSPSGVVKLMREGRLPCFSAGRRLLCENAALVAWLQRQRDQPAGVAARVLAPKGGRR